MGDITEIGWTDHTFNAWWGCSKVSAGCDNCYAEAWDTRWGGDHWGAGKPRRIMKDSYWKKPLKWNRQAQQEGQRHRVFCSSMADVFDKEAPDGQRDRLWKLIRETPWLDWQLLTKRPQNIRKYLPADWDYPNNYTNIWLGITAENKEELYRRIGYLLSVAATVHFMSCEPLLEDLGPMANVYVGTKCGACDSQFYEPAGAWWNCNGCGDIVSGANPTAILGNQPFGVDRPKIDWVIIGAESGNSHREYKEEWGRNIKDECVKAGVKVYLKQYADERGKKISLPVLDGRQWAEFPG